MKYKHIIFFLLVILSVIFATVCGIYHYYLYMCFSILFVLLFSFNLFKLYRQYPRKMKLMLESLQNEDTMFQFTENRSDIYQREFSTYLNKIKDIIQNEKMEVRVRDKYFEVLMDNVVTGIVTLDSDGYVVNINDRALKLLGMEVFTHISQYERLDSSVFNRLSVNSTKLMLNSKEMTLYAINDIQDELEENEQDSWKKLIRVLTHEIMNTITPISSLSDTLRDLGRQNLNENKEKISEGLAVISSTSKGLIAFVNSYRMMTKEPLPVKHAVLVRDIFNQVCVLEKEEVANSRTALNKATKDKTDLDKTALDVDISVNLKNKNLMIYADGHQIVQVLINLVKNAIDAQATKINLSALEDKTTEDIYIEVSNNGKRISDEDASHIFVPFFTTKKKGNGIGLSLSRRIMILHSGRLRLISSTAKETKFVLIFR